MVIKYRKARVEDYEGIYYVSCYSWDETYRGYMPDQYLDDRINNFEMRSLKTKKYLKKLADEDNIDKYLVCEVDGKIVGICQYLNSQNDSYKGMGLLGALYVLKKYQGLGIGKELFKLAVDGLIEMGYEKMYLECLIGNRTINFYKKYDGRVADQIKYAISDFLVDADIVVFDDLNKTKELLN